MTAKETKIKEAYESAGVDWEQVKEFLDKDGFIKSSTIMKENNKLYRELAKFFQTQKTEFRNNSFDYRPKSLSGIENNNGWIAIESENNLPPDGHYWTINKNGEINASPKLVDETCNDNQYWLSTFTHYQPILKPKPPIY